MEVAVDVVVILRVVVLVNEEVKDFGSCLLTAALNGLKNARMTAKAMTVAAALMEMLVFGWSLVLDAGCCSLEDIKIGRWKGKVAHILVLLLMARCFQVF